MAQFPAGMQVLSSSVGGDVCGGCTVFGWGYRHCKKYGEMKPQGLFLIKSPRAGTDALWQSEKTRTRGSPAVWEGLTGHKVREAGSK